MCTSTLTLGFHTHTFPYRDRDVLKHAVTQHCSRLSLPVGYAHGCVCWGRGGVQAGHRRQPWQSVVIFHLLAVHRCPQQANEQLSRDSPVSTSLPTAEALGLQVLTSSSDLIGVGDPNSGPHHGAITPARLLCFLSSG